MRPSFFNQGIFNKQRLLTIAVVSTLLLSAFTAYLWTVLPQPELVFSISIRLAACIIALVAFFHWQDWRPLPLALMFFLMAARQLLSLYIQAGIVEKSPATALLNEIPGFIVTLLALISILYLWDLFSKNKGADQGEKQPPLRQHQRLPGSENIKSNSTNSFLLLIFWTLLIVALMGFSYYQQSNFTQDIAIADARANFQKDIAIRRWASSHGGVYVPADKQTPPNQYLQHIPSRDIVKPDGTPLTLMNPAYMIRQLNEFFSQEYGVSGHITSLKPLRPENKPDEWERKALLAFEEGAQELLEFTELDGEPVLRLMQPMMTEKSCLKCHAHQNYTVGDVRGGVGITLPVGALLAENTSMIVMQFVGLSCLWLLGVAILLFQNKRVQESHSRTEYALQTLQRERDRFMQGPVMTFTWKNSKNWPVEQVSDNVFELLGYTPEELLDGSLIYATLIHPDDLPRVFNEVTENSTPDSRHFVHEPYRLRHKSGTWLWILDHTTLIRDSRGAISDYSGYMIDITSSMLMQEELLEAKNNLELVIKNTRVGIWDWHIQSGETIFNERWAEIIGYSLKELAPISINTWMGHAVAEDLPGSEKALKAHWDGTTDDYSYECRMKHKNGTIIWVLDTGKVVEWNEDGSPKRMVGTHIDITKHKEDEQHLVLAKEEAETANQAKSVFLANMSHELRTPLNAILGYAQIFAQDSSLSSEQQKGINTMRQSGEHLLLLINDILDISKVEAGKMELVETEFRLPEFLHGVADIVRVRARQTSIIFSYVAGDTLPASIWADELRLRQVILNLLSNGVKFTSRGQCSLAVQAIPVDEKTCRLTVSVEDTGPGIPPAMQEKVFLPFQQSGERLQYSEGSGLGLAISRKMVAMMGGTLQLESPIHSNPAAGEGPGCRFSFSIDVAIGAATSMSAARQEKVVIGYKASGEDAPPKKILIVDDKISNRAVLRDTLAPLGFACHEAVDGSEVLAACEESRPDLILMDLRMPKVDGFAETEQLKSHGKFADIPVIAITADSTDLQKLEIRCLEHGFADYLRKPYIISELLEKIARHIHIELQYKEDERVRQATVSGEEMDYPPRNILDQLRELLELGDLDGLIAVAQAIAEEEPDKYQAFSRHIIEMAEAFQLSRLETVLNKTKEA